MSGAAHAVSAADLSRATVLQDLLAGATPQGILSRAYDEFGHGLALVSSFGTESAVLLHMVADLDRSLPVLFLDTGKLFGETLRYRDMLVRHLGLTGVQTLTPQAPMLDAEDADGMLFHRDYDRCCFLRKVAPLSEGLAGYAAWINGRKGHHGDGRAAMPVVEADGARVKFTPLAGWGSAEIAAYFEAHDLPRHPLEEDGYPSVGCYTCTSRVAAGGDIRSGRWAGTGKTECGIHTVLSSVSPLSRPDGATATPDRG